MAQDTRLAVNKTEKLLRRVGYYASLRRWGRARSVVSFPDLSTPPSPVTNGFGVPTPKRPPLPPDAERFPVGNSHKQGLELITPGSRVSDYNGAKK
jgi:hypothetical protein